MAYGSCNVCGLEMDRDPALEVECPQCGADIGSPCKRPSGHTVWGGAHQARIYEGVSEVCPEAGEPCWSDDEKPDPEPSQPSLSDFPNTH